MTTVRLDYVRDADGIVTLTTLSTLPPDGPEPGEMPLAAAVQRLYDEQDRVRGVLLVIGGSPELTPGVGLKTVLRVGPEEAAQVFADVQAEQEHLRRLERYPRPVAAAVVGTALGAPFAITLAAGHRVLLDRADVEVGLPDITALGLLPAPGGVTRLVRLLGVVSALTDVLLPGVGLRPGRARKLGLVDDLATDVAGVRSAARAWLQAAADDPEAAMNRWDRPGYRLPGGSPAEPSLAGVLPTLPALLRQQTHGAVTPAQRAVLATAVESAQTDLDTGLRIESRSLTNLVTGRTSANLAHAFLAERRFAVLPPSESFCDLLVRARLGEALRLLGEGVAETTVERAAAQAGYPSRLRDVYAGLAPAEAAQIGRWPAPAAAQATPTPAAEQQPIADVRDRLLFAEALAAAAAVADGTATDADTADVDSLRGAGFPSWTGGAVRFIHNHEPVPMTGSPVPPGGPAVFVRRADALADAYGDRFRPSGHVRALAATAGR